MLNLPDNWDYTLKGLSTICSDGLTSVRNTLVELEKHGYVKRERMRDEHGRLAHTEYSIFEVPQPVVQTNPQNPHVDNSP